jgi:hypothetical protein
VNHVQAGAWIVAITLCVILGGGASADAAETGDVLAHNLLANGDAEAHRCTSDWTAQTPVPGWRVVRGAASVLCYDAFVSTGESPALPSKTSGGHALFVGPGIDSAIEQSVDLSGAARATDGGALDYQLAAWVGGWAGRSESALVTAVFLDGLGHATGAPVVLADPGASLRGNRTALVSLAHSGKLPSGTRRITVTVDFPSGFSSYQTAFADNISLTLGPAGAGVRASVLLPPRSVVPPLDHVYVVMMENTNFADVVHTHAGSFSIDARMPFLESMARSGVLLTDFWATYHPSDQNYVAMIAGDTYKYGPVYYPDYDLHANHIGDLLNARGESWRAYVQHMNTPCNLVADSDGGWFAPDDEPFAQFQDVIGNPHRCLSSLRDLSDFQSAIHQDALPDFAWIAADGWWDGEGAWYDNYDVGVSISRQDEFLRSTFAPLLNSRSWKESRSLLIITWDESGGWGWPDNHVATVLVGSPGLLHEGSVVGTHYDGYGVLRTIEGALGVQSLDRFDEFARPLNEVFSDGPGERDQEGALLRPAESVITRGSLADTFGRVTTPAAVRWGEPLVLTVPSALARHSAVLVESLGRAPGASSARYDVDLSSGTAVVRTEGLKPGAYAAWLSVGGGFPVHAGFPITILPKAHVLAQVPGVEIVGSAASSGFRVREGGNLIVRYCRPAGASADSTWIGVFAVDTPADQFTKDNANLIGYWLKTPGSDSKSPCGQALAYSSELAPNAQYEVLLFEDAADGSSHAVGHGDRFTLDPALPGS